MKTLCKDGIHHTEYVLVAGYGKDKGKVFPFPEKNFLLTTEEHQQQVRNNLAERNLTLKIEDCS